MSVFNSCVVEYLFVFFLSLQLSFLERENWLLCLNFVVVALRPMSTAMVIAGRSVHLTTLFPGQA